MNSKLLGSIMIVAGTTIGAGMLLLPLKTAGVGFSFSLGELVLFYFLMLIPAYCIIELCQFAPAGTSMGTLVKLGLGKIGLYANNIVFYLLVYSIIIAYFSGVSGILADVIGLAGTQALIFKIVVSLALGFIVMFSTRIADLINQVFFYVMILAFLILVAISLVHLKAANLEALPVGSKAIIGSIPVLYLVYGFHLIIPSLSDYLDRNVRDLKIACTVGLAIPFVLLVLWSLVINGITSQADLLAFIKGGSVSVAALLEKSSSNSLIGVSVNVFSIGALVTSFIGIGLAILTTLRDAFRKPLHHKATDSNKVVEVDEDSMSEEELVETKEHVETSLHPVFAYALAFILPMVVMLLVPGAFAIFLGFASVLFCIQSFLLPMLSLYVVRKHNGELYKKDHLYRVALPNVAVAGLAIVLFILSILEYFL